MRAHAPQYIAAFCVAWIVVAALVRSLERGAWYDLFVGAAKAAAILAVLTWGGFFKS